MRIAGAPRRRRWRAAGLPMAALAAVLAAGSAAAGTWEPLFAANPGVAGAVRITDLDGGYRPSVVAIGGARAHVLRGPDWQAQRAAVPDGGAAAVADVDGDGRLDVVIGAGAWVALRGDGAGGTTAAPLVLDGARQPAPRALYAADADGDGRPDLLAVAATGSRWWLNRGGLRFTAGPGLPGAVDALVEDLDGDGVDDVLLLDGRSAPALVSGRDRSGAVTIAAARGARQVLPGDIDNDADVDLLVLSGTGDGQTLHWRVLRNDGGFAFTAVANGPEPVYAAVLADQDNDGLLDVLAVTAAGRLQAHPAVGRAPLAPPGAPLELAATGAVTQIAAADLDRDGRIEIVVAAGDGRLVGWRANDRGGHWLGVDLPVHGGSGAGAPRIEAIRKDGGRISRRLHGHTSVVLGLGALSQIDLVAVYRAGGVNRWQPDRLDRYVALALPAVTPAAAGRRVIGTPQRFFYDGRYECR